MKEILQQNIISIILVWNVIFKVKINGITKPNSDAESEIHYNTIDIHFTLDKLYTFITIINTFITHSEF